MSAHTPAALPVADGVVTRGQTAKEEYQCTIRQEKSGYKASH